MKVTPFSIRIRRLEERDISQAAELERMNLSREAWSEQALADMLSNQNSIFLAAVRLNEEREEEDIAGICCVTDIVGEGEITNVSVRKDYRRRKIASGMLKQLLEEGAKAGISAFTLEVRAGNAPAVRLYEGFGFQCEGVRPGFYRNPTEDALIMWKR